MGVGEGVLNANVVVLLHLKRGTRWARDFFILVYGGGGRSMAAVRSSPLPLLRAAKPLPSLCTSACLPAPPMSTPHLVKQAVGLGVEATRVQRKDAVGAAGQVSVLNQRDVLGALARRE